MRNGYEHRLSSIVMNLQYDPWRFEPWIRRSQVPPAAC